MKFTRKHESLVIFAAILVLLVLIGVFAFIKLSSQPGYIGSNATLIKPDGKTILEINGSVLEILPRMDADVQTNTKVTKFTGKFAQGFTTFTDHSSDIQFIAVESGSLWKIIVQNRGDKLNLPDLKVAKQYQLPKGWYKNS